MKQKVELTSTNLGFLRYSLERAGYKTFGDAPDRMRIEVPDRDKGPITITFRDIKTHLMVSFLTKRQKGYSQSSLAELYHLANILNHLKQPTRQAIDPSDGSPEIWGFLSNCALATINFQEVIPTIINGYKMVEEMTDLIAAGKSAEDAMKIFVSGRQTTPEQSGSIETEESTTD